MKTYSHLRLLMLSISFFLLHIDADAQVNRQKRSLKRRTKEMSSYRIKKPFGNMRYTTVGISVNALNYFGDISPMPNRLSTDIAYTRPGFGVSYTHKMGPLFKIKVEMLYGAFSASDDESAVDRSAVARYRLNRNISFRNRVEELSITTMFDLFHHHGFYLHRHEWVPYVYAGGSVFHHNPQGRVPATDLNNVPFPNAGEWVDLQPLGTEGQFSKLDKTDANYGIKPYSRIQVALPIGAGLRIRWNQTMDIWFELSFRYLFTDYIDDVSRNYVDLGVLKSDLARSMSYRTNELGPPSPSYDYVGRDGKTYTVLAGYGSEQTGNFRGGGKDNDILMFTTVRLTHIVGKTHKGKSRYVPSSAERR